MERLRKDMSEICVDKTDCKHDFVIDKEGEIKAKSSGKKRKEKSQSH